MKIYRLLTLFVVLGLLAACFPPAAPDAPLPMPVGPGPRLTRGFGEGVACALNGSAGWEGGPFVEDHQFPRLKASNGNYVTTDANVTLLNATQYFDLVEWVADRHNWYANACVTIDSHTYLRNANPKIKLFGVYHSYGFSDPTLLNPTCNTNIQDMWAAYDSNDWYMSDWTGSPVTWHDVSQTTYVMNWSGLQPTFPITNSLSSWWASHIISDTFAGAQCGGVDCWDGVILEAVGVPHSYRGDQWDIDEDGVRDYLQVGMGRQGVSEAQYEGWEAAFTSIISDTNLVVMTDGGWQPDPADIDGRPIMSDTVNIAQAFDWPTDITYLYDCGSTYSACPWSPPAGKQWDFAMRQYVTWLDVAGPVANSASYVNAMGFYDDIAAKSYSGTTTWGTYITSIAQYQRFLLASTLLDNGYAQVHAGQLPKWCDECGVDLVTGRSAQTVAATGYLGCPLEEAVSFGAGKTLRDFVDAGDWQYLSSYVWKREFTNGLVIVNPLPIAQTVNIGTGWKKIYSPSGAVTHNTGATISGNLTIGAMNAYVLLRENAPTPTPFLTDTPTPTATPTHTATPTWTPGGPTATPTPTATATPTATPTWTPTATPTATPTWTPTPAATATPTPVQIVCPALDATIDGSLAEWTSSTPSYLLSAANADYINPAATPSAADLSAAFWLACSGSNLLAAGIITDSVVLVGAGDIYTGDAAQLSVDGLNDGITRPGQDDHEFMVNPDGLLLNYRRPVPGATVEARTTPASNWRFEMSIPLAQIWPYLESGDVLGYLFALWDNDATPTPNPSGTPGPDSVDRIMVGPRGELQLGP